MPVTFSSYRLGPGQRVSNKTVPPPWDWLLRRENELGPRRSRSQIIFAVLVPPFYVAVQAPALIVTNRKLSICNHLHCHSNSSFFAVCSFILHKHGELQRVKTMEFRHLAILMSALLSLLKFCLRRFRKNSPGTSFLPILDIFRQYEN